MAYLMTATEFVNKAKEIEKTKTAYMWGTYGRKITQSLITAKAKQYPNRYTIPYQVKLKGFIGTHYGLDCCGMIKGILWGWDGVKDVPYSVNGVPDTNVMGYYKRGLDKSSDFSKIVPGACVHLPTHVGIYIGDGLVVEATSAWESCVMITALGNIGNKAGYRTRNWNSWYKLPWVDYSRYVAPTPEPSPDNYIEYVVKKGDTPWALAVKYLGAGTKYTEIMKASGLANTAAIYVGQVLRIPSKENTPAPSLPSTPAHPPTTQTFKVGDVVEFTGNLHYTNSNAQFGVVCTPGKAKVTAVSPNTKHPYHLVKEPGTSNVYGWVDTKDIQAIDKTPGKTIDDLAKEVIAGKWGNGQDRLVRLTNAGYSYNAVQDRVNQLLKK